MLELISGGFKKAQDLLQGKTVIQEKHIDEAVKAIRISLLEADVEFHVVKTFIDGVKEKALGEIIQTRVSHGGKKLKGILGSSMAGTKALSVSSVRRNS